MFAGDGEALLHGLDQCASRLYELEPGVLGSAQKIVGPVIDKIAGREHRIGCTQGAKSNREPEEADNSFRAVHQAFELSRIQTPQRIAKKITLNRAREASQT